MCCFDEKGEVLTERVVTKAQLGQNAFGPEILVKKHRASFFSLHIAFRPTPWAKSVF
jgi:hypothetical protein